MVPLKILIERSMYNNKWSKSFADKSHYCNLVTRECKSAKTRKCKNFTLSKIVLASYRGLVFMTRTRRPIPNLKYQMPTLKKINWRCRCVLVNSTKHSGIGCTRSTRRWDESTWWKGWCTLISGTEQAWAATYERMRRWCIVTHQMGAQNLRILSLHEDMRDGINPIWDCCPSLIWYDAISIEDYMGVIESDHQNTS